MANYVWEIGETGSGRNARFLMTWGPAAMRHDLDIQDQDVVPSGYGVFLLRQKQPHGPGSPELRMLVRAPSAAVVKAHAGKGAIVSEAEPGKIYKSTEPGSALLRPTSSRANPRSTGHRRAAPPQPDVRLFLFTEDGYLLQIAQGRTPTEAVASIAQPVLGESAASVRHAAGRLVSSHNGKGGVSTELSIGDGNFFIMVGAVD